MKQKISLIIAILLFTMAVACDITVVTCKVIISLEKYGFILSSEGFIIENWLPWLLSGNFLFIPSYICFIKAAKVNEVKK